MAGRRRSESAAQPARQPSWTSAYRSPPGFTRSTTRRSTLPGNLYVTFSGSRGPAAAGVGVQGRRRRRARAVRERPVERDVDGLRPRGPAARLQPVRRERPPGGRAGARRRSSQPTWAWRAELPSDRTATSSSATDPDPSFASRASGPKSSRPSRRALPRFIWRSDPKATCTSRRRRCRLPMGCIESRRTARSSSSATPFGRPQGIAFDADGRLYVVDALAGNSGSVPSRHQRGRPRWNNSSPEDR